MRLKNKILFTIVAIIVFGLTPIWIHFIRACILHLRNIRSNKYAIYTGLNKDTIEYVKIIRVVFDIDGIFIIYRSIEATAFPNTEIYITNRTRAKYITPIREQEQELVGVLYDRGSWC